MGAIRTRLESFKQPKQPRSSRGRLSTQKFGPSKGSRSSSDLKSAFSLARALQKDEQSAQNSASMAEANVMRHQSRFDNAASLNKILDQLNLEADDLLSSLPEN